VISLFATVLLLPAWAEECAEPVPLQRLVSGVEQAEQRYASLEAASFVDAVDLLVLDLPCVDSVVPAPLVARYHVLMGLRWYVQGDEGRARASFASARAAEPALELPESLLPQGHEVRSWVLAAQPGEGQPVPEPVSVSLLFDGHAAPQGHSGQTIGQTIGRPADRPSVLQLVDETGALLVTRYLLPEDELPPYEAKPLSPEQSGEPPPRKRRWGWLVVGGAGAVTSAVLYGLAADQARTFAGQLPPEVGRPELLTLRTRTNLLVAGSVLSGGAGVVGVTGFVVRW
jgi:hypothetical protein